jgi:hypothetical protein
MQQPPSGYEPRWSPDGMWYWDGARWVPASQAPIPPPPSPAGYPYVQAAPYVPYVWKPSPGLRTFLIVVLAIDVAVTGFMTIFGVLGVAGGADEPGGAILLSIFAVLVALAVVALVGVVMRAVWARWVALVAGIAVSLTCLGSIVGIPIIVAAARAPIREPA